MRDTHPYVLDGSVVIQTTDHALRVLLDDDTEVWVPRSVVVDGEDIVEDDTDIEVQAWWAEKEGII